MILLGVDSPAQVDQARAAAQREHARRRANEVRLAAAAVKADLAAGRITLVQALHDDRADCLPIETLLRAQRHWGPDRSRQLLARLHITATRRVRDLTARQLDVIATHAGSGR